MLLAEYIQDVKHNVSLSDVLSGLGVKVPRTGLINCPFPDHSDKTGSFKIYQHSDFFKCFGRCGRRGDIFDLVQGMLNVDLIGAMSYISDNHGVAMFQGDGRQRPKDSSLIFAAMEFLVDYAYKELRSVGNKDVLESLIKHYGFDGTRGLDHFKVGFLPKDNSFVKALHSEMDEGDDLLVRMGIGKKTSRGVWNSFAGRIIFPYLKNGKVVYIIARKIPWIEHSDGDAYKYVKQKVGTPDNPSCISNIWLYNEDFVLSKGKDAIVTEGPPDVISGWEKGFNVTAPCTSKFREADAKYLAKKLARFPNRYICTDAEKSGAGDAGGVQMYTLMKERKVECKMARLPFNPNGIIDKIDMNLYFKHHAASEFQVILDTSKTYLNERITALASVPDANSLRAEIENIQKYVGHDKIDIGVAAQDISDATGKLGKRMISDILRGKSKEAKKAKREKKSVIQEIPISDVGGKTILRGANSYTEVFVAGEDEVRTRITNFVMDISEKRYEIKDIASDGTFKYGTTYYTYSVKVHNKRAAELNLCARDMTGTKKFMEACATQGITLEQSLNDTRISNILNAEASRKMADVGYIEKIGRVGGSNFVAGNVMIIDGKLYESEDSRFVLEGDREVVVGRAHEEEDEGEFQKIFLKTKNPYDGYVSDVFNEMYNVYAYQGLIGIAWLLAGHFRQEIVDSYRCFPICNVTGARGKGKSWYMGYLTALAGNPPVASIDSTAAAMCRKMNHYSGVPVVLDEYRVDAGKGKDQLFRSIYDGTPVDKAHLGNQRGIISYKAKSSLIFSGQDIPADAALCQRLVEIDLGDGEIDKEYCLKHLEPLKEAMSYIYFEHIRKPLIPSSVIHEEVRACHTMIKKYIESKGRKVIARQVTNWAPVLWGYQRFMLPIMNKNTSIEGFLDWILFKISEADILDRTLDPMLCVLGHIKELDFDDRFDISTYIRVNEKDGVFQIRWSPLIQDWRSSQDLRDSKPLGKASIMKQFISTFRSDMEGNNVKKTFLKGGRFVGQFCTTYRLKARHPYLVDLINHFQGNTLDT